MIDYALPEARGEVSFAKSTDWKNLGGSPIDLIFATVPALACCQHLPASRTARRLPQVKDGPAQGLTQEQDHCGRSHSSICSPQTHIKTNTTTAPPQLLRSSSARRYHPATWNDLIPLKEPWSPPIGGGRPFGSRRGKLMMREICSKARGSQSSPLRNHCSLGRVFSTTQLALPLARIMIEKEPLAKEQSAAEASSTDAGIDDVSPADDPSPTSAWWCNQQSDLLILTNDDEFYP